MYAIVELTLGKETGGLVDGKRASHAFLEPRPLASRPLLAVSLAVPGLGNAAEKDPPERRKHVDGRVSCEL